MSRAGPLALLAMCSLVCARRVRNPPWRIEGAAYTRRQTAATRVGACAAGADGGARAHTWTLRFGQGRGGHGLAAAWEDEWTVGGDGGALKPWVRGEP